MENDLPLPAYKEIVEETARQFNARKGLFLRRIAFVWWPFVVLGIVMAVVYVSLIVPFAKQGYAVYGTPPSETWALYIVWGGATYLVLMILWVITARTIFSIEKNIWTDSFFDRVPLSPEQSWHISKKLFLSIVRLKFRLFMHYGALAIVVFLGLLWGLFKITTVFPDGDTALYIVFVGTPVLASLLFVYVYIISIKLRYVYFLFLDLYGTEDYSSRKVLQAMWELNHKIKNADLKKILSVQFGTDAISVVIGAVTNIFISAIPQSTPTGRATRGGLQTAVAIVDSEIREYALIIGNYMIYRAIWTNIYGAPPKVNENVYKLAD